MKHIILFCYIFTILIGASALTIQWVFCKGVKTRDNRIMKFFMWALLAMNAYDFFIYYNDNILLSINRNLLLSIGDCLIAILVYVWLLTKQTIEGRKTFPKTVKGAGIYIILYLVIWIISVSFFGEIRWIRAVIDVPLLLILLLGSAGFIYKGFKEGKHIRMMQYQIIVTIFMTLTYGTYFLEESGLYNSISFIGKGAMDLTIFYWFVINVANMMFFYRKDYNKIEENIEELSIEEKVENALKELQEKFNLTAREKELVQEIYEGKTNAEIGQDLFISESTVKAHIYNIFKKLEVKNRMEVILKVREKIK